MPINVVIVPDPIRLSKRRTVQAIQGISYDGLVRRYASEMREPLVYRNNELIKNRSGQPRDGDVVTILSVPADPTGGALTAFFIGLAKGLTLGAVAGGSATVAAGGTAVTIGTFVGSTLLLTAASFGLSYAAAGLVGSQDQDAGGRGENQPSPTLRGLNNAIRPFEPIPNIHGRHRIFPPFGAQPWTEIVGADQFVRLLLLVGHGPMRLTDLRIGETPIADFGNVKFQLREGRSTDPDIQFYTQSVESLSLAVGYNIPTFAEWQANHNVTVSPWHTFRMNDSANFSVDLAFTGMFRINESGSNRDEQISIQIEYKPVALPQTDWLSAITDPNNQGTDSGLEITGTGVPVSKINADPAISSRTATLQIGPAFKQSPFLLGLTWGSKGFGAGGIDRSRNPETGFRADYEVRIRRLDITGETRFPGGPDVSAISTDFTWFTLRGFNDDDPLTIPSHTNVATISMRIKLTEQFGGVVNSINVLAERELPIYDPTSQFADPVTGWTTQDIGIPGNEIVTRNPAAAMLDVFRGPMHPDPVPDSMIDWDAFSSFYQNAEADGRFFDYVADSKTTRLELAQLVARSAFADFDQLDEFAVSVIEDRVKTTPTQLITPRTMRDVLIEQVWEKEIHGVKLRFFDETNGYEPNSEIIAYADGFSEDGAGGTTLGTIFDTVSVSGITNPDKVWKFGRRLLATAKLRPRAIQCTQNLEHRVSRRGDLVLFAHDAALLGQSWGRIKSVSNAALWYTFDDVLGFSPIFATVLLDKTVKKVGDASVQFTSTGASFISILLLRFTNLLVDWTGFSIRLWVFVADAASLSATDGVRMFINDDVAGVSIWRHGTGDGIVAGQWSQITFDLSDTPDTGGGTVSSVLSVLMQLNTQGNQAGRVFWLDELEILAPTGEIISMELDQGVTFEENKGYRMQIRTVDTSAVAISMVQADVANPVGNNEPDLITQTIELVTALIAAPLPIAGDVFAFGETGLETREMLVNEIQHSADLDATLTLIDYSPDVFTADAGPIPDFDTGSSFVTPVVFRPPAPPTILDIFSDERALAVSRTGTMVPRIIILIARSVPSTASAAATYEIQIRISSTTSAVGWTDRPSVSAQATTLIIDGVDEGTEYDIRIRGATTDGRFSSWSQIDDHVVVGKSTLPPDVGNFRLEGTNIWWDTPFQAVDFAGYRVRFNRNNNRNWDNGLSAHGFSLLTGPPLDIGSLPTGELTLMIKGEDIAGNQSANTAYIIKDIGSPEVANVVKTEDLHAAGFGLSNFWLADSNPFWLTDDARFWVDTFVLNGSIEMPSGDLVADQPLDFWSGDDSALFWSGISSALFWTAISEQMTYQVAFTPEVADIPASLELNTTFAGVPSIEYRTDPLIHYWGNDPTVDFWSTDSALSWSPGVGWQPWPGRLDAVRQKYEFRVTLAGGKVQGRIEAWDWQLDVPDLIEDQNDVAIGSGGTRLTLVGSFRAIVQIIATLQNSSTGITVQIADKSVALGPLVNVLDAAGLGTTGDVDVRVKGY